MDINNVNNQNIGDRKIADKRSAPAGGAPEAREEKRDRDDSVELSRAADKLTRLEASIRDADAVDEARVAAIKKEIAEGRYHIDPERLAQKIIELEDQLIGAMLGADYSIPVAPAS